MPHTPRTQQSSRGSSTGSRSSSSRGSSNAWHPPSSCCLATAAPASSRGMGRPGRLSRVAPSHPPPTLWLCTLTLSRRRRRRCWGSQHLTQSCAPLPPRLLPPCGTALLAAGPLPPHRCQARWQRRWGVGSTPTAAAAAAVGMRGRGRPPPPPPAPVEAAACTLSCRSLCATPHCCESSQSFVSPTSVPCVLSSYLAGWLAGPLELGGASQGLAVAGSWLLACLAGRPVGWADTLPPARTSCWLVVHVLSSVGADDPSVGAEGWGRGGSICGC